MEHIVNEGLMGRISLRVLLVALGFVFTSNAAFSAPLKGGVEEVAPVTPMQLGVEDDDFRDSKPLSGAMEFSETVPPVDAKFKPHKLFAAENLPQEETEDGWYQIPAWRAGRFHRDTQTNHSIFGDVTINSSVDHVYGMQVDKRGGIWHHESWPKVTKIELDDYTEYKIIHRYEPIVVTKKEFVIKTFETDIDVDKKTGKIRMVSKQEGYIRYRPCAQDVACANCTTLGFSQYGRINTTLERSTLEEVRTDPFRVVNVFRGVNLRDSFKRYLKAHDLENLDPDL